MMKEIKLKKLELTNFKGIAHRIEEFADGENFLFGANGTGKTTLFDAFTWVLFGRDSAGQADNKANIKTLDENNKPIMGMDNTVEATFDVDGKKLVLKRSYVEVWTKHAGEENKTYEGQTTKYSWDGNEKISKSEYSKRIADLISEGLFKLITDPNYFASLDAKERRKIVLALAGEVTDEEIKFVNPQLLNFDASKDVDEQKQVAMSTKNRLAKDRDNYPARIDEQMQIISRKEQESKDMKLPNKDELLKRKEEIASNLEELENEQNNISATVQSILEKNYERIDLLKNIADYKHAKQSEEDSKVDKDNQAIKLAKQKYLDKQNEIGMIHQRIKNGEVMLKSKRIELAEQKVKHSVLQAEPIPDFSVETVCPTCKRELDESLVLESKQLLGENWIKQQKEKISKHLIECNNLFEEGSKYKTAIEELKKELNECNLELEGLENEAKKELKDYKEFEFDKDQVYKDMINNVPEELSVDEEVENKKQSIIDSRAKLYEEQNNIEESLRSFYKIDIMKADINKCNMRIAKLRSDESEVNQQIARQEKIIYLCDLWTKTKTELLTRKVQSKFNLVKFKMFNYTKEGNAVPTCEIVVNGVDYVSLNTASRINAGLDIINALIKHYEVKAPIFIDGRESVTKIDAPNTQIINLVVKEEK